jgi:hypothetical protein
MREHERRAPFSLKSFFKRMKWDEDGSFNVRVDRLFPGTGQGFRNDAVYVRNGIALSTTGQVTNTMPATGTILGTTTGRFRIKIYNGGGTTPTLVDLVVNATDGTNTVQVFSLHPSVAITLSTTSWFDRNFEYLLDMASSGSGGGATGQLLPGGATSFNILTTLGGTTPTASMDLEIVPLI